MVFKLFLLFVVMPIAEIAVLLHVGELIGGWTTFFIVIVTAIVGAHLVRAQGLAALAEIKSKSAQGVLPADSITEGLMILVAGVLLVTPGFITDAIGFLLTLPITRKPLAKIFLSQLGPKLFTQTVYASHHHGQPFSQDSVEDDPARPRNKSNNVIEGEWQRKDN
ncbi:FxsA family protein [Catenovulum sediminis]|uniref:FxsA family protein n=1 Tax=Catenovulum sediminis TaxID=1740262 RepID=A0ABV1RMQ4_9ALTE|nr:FxsA family protein [Catenovulum sediminis]